MTAGTNVATAVAAAICAPTVLAAGDSGSVALDYASAILAQPESTTNILGMSAAPIDTPLVTDRPDFTESTEAVPLGRAQIEMGYTFTYDGGRETFREHSAPELLVRLGVIENIELRIDWAGYVRSDDDGDVAEGADDLAIGAKFKLVEQDGAIPHFAVLVATSIPVGSSDVTSDDYNPAIGLAWAYDLTDRLALGGNVNVAWPTRDSGAQFFQPSASVALGLGLTEELGAYAEYFGFFDVDGTGGPAHSFNTGLTYLINNNFQLDGRVGFGLNGRADDFFIGAGLSVRF